MSKDELKVYIINYIKYCTRVSFIDLEELFESLHIEYQGEFTFVHVDSKNIVLWHGWSDEVISIVGDLLITKQLELERTDVTTYAKHGMYLDLPLMSNPFDYSDTRWLPVELKLGNTLNALLH
ncbi:hypothetical protein AST07_01370 [Staphylococcus saprophyticus]|uniref:hypothetical protein n=1 Tax=Staphylococcus TaxID=1279 RepID=UPI000852E6F1|nr:MULTISPECIES: hypothetical protein [Staphylococcus]MEB7812877.1 hypothetical protein [Staphylococcus xylosus]OEK93297.1 hypothetical protein AST07_01370 [Staphylococcus saprophyticus]